MFQIVSEYDQACVYMQYQSPPPTPSLVGQTLQMRRLACDFVVHLQQHQDFLWQEQ